MRKENFKFKQNLLIGDEMRVSSIEIENFLSIEKANINFNESGTLLIEGWNHDTDSANGAGKTSIVAAIAFLIFGKTPRVAGSGVIRRNCKQAVCSGFLKKKNIVYFLKRTKPGKLYVTRDNEEISEEEFQKDLVIDYDVFLLVQYFAQGLGQRFLDLNDTERKDLFIRLTSSFNFIKVKDTIDLEVKNLTNKINDLNIKESSLLTRISTYKESQQDIKNLLSNAEKITTSIEQNVIKIKQLEKVEKPDISKFTDLQKKAQLELDQIIQNKGASVLLRKKLKQIESEKEPEDTCDGFCPSCSESIDIVDGVFNKHDSLSFQAKIKAWNQNKKVKKIEIVESLKELELSLDKEDELKSIIDRCYSKIRDQRESYIKTESRISELKNFIKLKKQELDSVKSSIETQSSIFENISKSETILSKVLKEKESITNETMMLQAASQILSPMGIQAYILDSVIETFNDKINANLQTAWSDCRYELKTHKENKSGSIVAKMSDNLVINGTAVDIGTLSGGERKCLALAIDLALLDTYLSYSNTDLNPIVLDEPFDHLDSINRSRIFELLQESSKSKQIIVIDHSSEFKALFDNIMHVSKKNEISTVL